MFTAIATDDMPDPESDPTVVYRARYTAVMREISTVLRKAGRLGGRA